MILYPGGLTEGINRYTEKIHDRNSPVEHNKRERSRIDIVSPGLENSDLDLDPNPKACRWRDEVLILVADGANLLCQGCGNVHQQLQLQVTTARIRVSQLFQKSRSLVNLSK